MIAWLACALITGAVSMAAAWGFWRHRMKWWEFLVQLPLPFVVCWGIAAAGTWGLTSDSEYVSGYITQARYYEPWNERVARQVPVYATRTVRNPDGTMRSERYVSHYKTVYETVYHAAYWTASGSNGGSWRISKDAFESLAKRWGNRTFVELNRHSHTLDGDRYDTTFPGDDATLEPCTVTRGYENRTQAAPNLFRYHEFETENQPVRDYPREDGWHVPTTIGPVLPSERHAFDVLNARLGKVPDTRIWAVVHEGGSIAAGQAQEAHWKGGNRNELVIVIGVNTQRRPVWAWIFGWTTADTLKVKIRQQVLEQEKLDLVALATWLRTTVPGEWKPRDFAEFDYIHVPPPPWSILLGCFIAACLNALLTWWLVANEFFDRWMRRPLHRI